MDDTQEMHATQDTSTAKLTVMMRIKRYVHIARLVGEYLFDDVADATVDSVKVIYREARLFFGMLLTVVGVLNFRNGKYCDGNTVDYLSCTRPTVYYYYSAFEMFLVALGVALILVWLLKRWSPRE